jgi:glycosyltransferase involved in cell wall biosynthesis
LTFVRAAAHLKATLPEALFVWCGDGELRAETESLAAQLNVPLIVPGHQENSAAIMRAFDVFVLPSIYEGLPFALLEAMALGLPIVATDISGVRDVLGREAAGWLTAPQDAQALATKIAHAWKQPDEAQRRARAAQQLVTTRFSVEHMVQQHLALYEAVLREKSDLPG